MIYIVQYSNAQYSTNIEKEERYLIRCGRALLDACMLRKVAFVPPHVQLKEDDLLTCKVRLVNTSGAATTFSFDTNFLPSWLVLQPQDGNLSMADSFQEITLTVILSLLPEPEPSREPDVKPPTTPVSIRLISPRFKMLERKFSFASNLSSTFSRHDQATVVLVCRLNHGRTLLLPVCVN